MNAAANTPEAPRGAAPKAVRWTIVLAVVLTAVLEVLDSTIVNVALPQIQAAFGITNDQTVWILTSYIVASVVVMPLTGFFVRMVGRRRLITSAIVGFAAFSALCGLSWSVEVMVACRLGQGIFGAFLIPLSQSILFDSFPKEKRGQAMAFFGLGVVVAPVLGPTIGALLTEYFSWRAVFYVNLPIAAFALTMMTGELKSEDTHRIKVDWTGLALMVGAIASLQLMLDLGETRDWFASKLIQVAAITMIACATTFVLRGRGKTNNIIDFSLFRDRSFAGANVAILGFGVAMFGSIAILPLFVQGLLGYPVLDAGFLFIPRGIAGGISMVLTGSVLVSRFDPRKLLAVGLIMTGMGNILLGQLNLNAGFWNLAWPGVVSGLGMGLFFVPMSTLAFQNIGPDKQDEASGIYGVTRSLGSSVGIALVGWQVASRMQFHYATLSAGITPFDAAARAWLAPLGLDPSSAAGAAQIAGQIQQQASLLAFQDAFWLTGVAAFLMLPVVLILQRPKATAAPAMAH
ncbi:DHA2 family efflux MFS transporter permease subunit [Sagittula stellata]|uniref:Probable multidrug resistance protein n=1 Tax=Sagittula stellata (strain ATCC 700073 / DSM 11524 / E-37) TaxID=388399 RepID=A3JYY3_SAGS3|nr:DHA2 family efflux MFS transporter permease subunit [Sagittula stellata]EBA09686.1 probable multidrug resistance protein [Sagittula stellata E-37]